ncbi:hypothetical protein A9Q83_18675 [Alphaproteobacteria bacterium 46_93_T64]|nr:hypothetical protein A9Q83_18675 [Alphaproteobacteria bacterium 46_93_T64]
MSGFRLSSGGLIDRNKPIQFTFDGKTYSGFEGDVLASALIANGVNLMGRSFKYHRPRGPVTAGSSEPNALVEIGEGGRKEPNVRATMAEVSSGLVAKSQNRWPSLDYDIGAINQILSPFLVAGFYYKTFMWPKSFWEKIYEPLIRKAAGLGSATYKADPDRYEKAYDTCDLLVIGSGPAGLMAALVAARSGARVIIADEGAILGGSLLYEDEMISGKSARNWLSEAVAELSSMDEVRVLPRTTVFGWYDGNIFGAHERVQKHVANPSLFKPVERTWRINAKRAVLASGAEERPLVFGGNDRPGVMLASAIRTYLARFAVSPGKRAVVFTNNSSGYEAARALIAKGVDVAAVLDSRLEISDPDLGEVPVIRGAVITDVKGGKEITSVEYSAGKGSQRINCDFVAMSGGWNPIVHLACHRGKKPVWSEDIAAFVSPDVGEGLVAVGAAAGKFLLSECLADGAEKGLAAVQSLGFEVAINDVPNVSSNQTFSISPLWSVAQSTGKAFVDFQNDVTVNDVPLAAREGYTDVELTKRYTTLGMATDQGKLSNINGLAILAEATGKSISDVGTTTYRPNYSPVSFGALSGPFRGHHFQPSRLTPTHQWAKEHTAVFVETGLWYRPMWFTRQGDATWQDSMIREVKNTRENVGVCDVSTLGKIDVQGPDAAEFMNRLYCNGWKKLPVGRARYGLMLREDGLVYDDGTSSRLSDDHYFMTTTTAKAAGVLSHMEFCLQALWPELDVQCVSVTEQWAQLAVAGPQARSTMQKIVADDISDDAFPYMGAREVTLECGIKARLFRISFSGELAYELSVPADFGDLIIRLIMNAGAEFGIMPYGTEALKVMRIEKGHVAGGELNGTTTAYDLGLGKMMSTKKDYIGRVMATREAFHEPNRWNVVGLLPLNKTEEILPGAHILNIGDEPSMKNDQGYITSSTYSPMAEQWIALALVNNGRKRYDEVVQVWDDLRKNYVHATICDPVFYDKEHLKLHATTLSVAKEALPTLEMKRMSPLDSKIQNGRFGMETGEDAGVSLSIRHPMSIVMIIARNGKSSAVSELMEKSYGVTCPLPGRSATGRNVTIHWTGAEQWIVTSNDLEEGDLYEQLARSLEGLASITDQSHGRLTLSVTGIHARNVLSKGTSVDLHPRVFGTGHCAVTQMAHVGVHVACTGTNEFELLLFRGFAESFWEWLTEMSEEFGYEVKGAQVD